MPNWLIAVLPLAGVAVGAVLQYFLGGAQARSARRMDETLAVYAEYLRTLTEGDIHAAEPPDPARWNAFQLARVKMTAYASGAVLAAAANLERARNEGDFAKYTERIKDLYQAMRDDTRGKGDEVDRQDLDMLLWGRDSKEWAKEWTEWTALKESTEQDH
jgi:hypothetical protein